MIRMFESSTAWPERPPDEAELSPPEPPEITVDLEAGAVVLVDRDEVVRYELRMSTGQGRGARVGWRATVTTADGTTGETGVTTAEVMAVLRDIGREEEAARMVLATAAWFERPGIWEGKQIGRRLRRSVDEGRSLRRLSVVPLQRLIHERRLAGESISDMCKRGGFVGRDGRLDTSWFQRRAGLIPDRCSKTGKLRRQRTAKYEVFCRLVRACGAEPHELGV